MRTSTTDTLTPSLPPLTGRYEQLLYTVFQQASHGKGRGMVVALTSVHPGAGVSAVTSGLVHELTRYELTSVAQVNSQTLRTLREPASMLLKASLSQPEGNFCDLNLSNSPVVSRGQSGPWEGSRQYRQDCIQLLRTQFDYSLIDCPSLKESGDLLAIAPFVDGILLVIEANVTRREQIQHAERMIEAANGNLLGHILNKRTYELPSWLFRRL